MSTQRWRGLFLILLWAGCALSCAPAPPSVSAAHIFRRASLEALLDEPIEDGSYGWYSRLRSAHLYIDFAPPSSPAQRRFVQLSFVSSPWPQPRRFYLSSAPDAQAGVWRTSWGSFPVEVITASDELRLRFLWELWDLDECDDASCVSWLFHEAIVELWDEDEGLIKRQRCVLRAHGDVETTSFRAWRCSLAAG